GLVEPLDPGTKRSPEESLSSARDQPSDTVTQMVSPLTAMPAGANPTCIFWTAFVNGSMRIKFPLPGSVTHTLVLLKAMLPPRVLTLPIGIEVTWSVAGAILSTAPLPRLGIDVLPNRTATGPGFPPRSACPAATSAAASIFVIVPSL